MIERLARLLASVVREGEIRVRREKVNVARKFRDLDLSDSTAIELQLIATLWPREVTK